MDSEQRFGTKSTFRQQVLSNRPSSPALKFGSGGRTAKIHEPSLESTLLGRTSAGPTAAVKSSLGAQAESRCRSAPAHRVPKAPLHDKVKGPSAGPGHYHTPVDTIGVQLLESQRVRSPAYKLASSQRFCDFKAGLTGEPVQSLLVMPKAPVGYLGDAPAWSFHGPKERRPATAGGSMSMCCPLAPTSAAAPGPAAYTTQLSSFGRQVPSCAASSPGVLIPRVARDQLMRQTLPRGQEHVLIGRASPGPSCPQLSSLGKQVVSRARSAVGVKFGSSDRFSDMKPVLPKKPSASSNGSSSNGSSSNGSRVSGTSGSSTARSRSATGSRGAAAIPEAWPFNSPGPGAYVV